MPCLSTNICATAHTFCSCSSTGCHLAVPMETAYPENRRGVEAQNRRKAARLVNRPLSRDNQVVPVCSPLECQGFAPIASSAGTERDDGSDNNGDFSSRLLPMFGSMFIRLRETEVIRLAEGHAGQGSTR